VQKAKQKSQENQVQTRHWKRPQEWEFSSVSYWTDLPPFPKS